MVFVFLAVWTLSVPRCEKFLSESLEQQIMFKDKYTRIFLRQIEAIVFIFLQLFLQRVGKVFTNSSPFIT